MLKIIALIFILANTITLFVLWLNAEKKLAKHKESKIFKYEDK